jgi:hypothetical protein
MDDVMGDEDDARQLVRQETSMMGHRATHRDVPRRPGVFRWLWYAVSGRLPASYRDWVLYDLTCPTWPLRHLARLIVPLVPVVAVLLVLLPGPAWVRGMAVALGSLIGLLYSFVFLYESTDRRAIKFGYPSGTTQEVREERRAARDLVRATEDFLRHRGPSRR